MERTSQQILKVGIERGYFSVETANEVMTHARLRKCSPERILLERRMLSVRRLERLRNHVQFRSMRKSDKAYAQLAVRCGMLSEREARHALRAQKRFFAEHRECRRVGADLIERGLLNLDDDRDLRARLGGRSSKLDPTGEQQQSSAQTLPLHEESVVGSSFGGNVSYRAIEAALERVEAIRAIQEDLSVSDHKKLSERITPDSAAEFENALSMLARRRASSSDSSEVRKTKRKSTGAFLAAVFRKKIDAA